MNTLILSFLLPLLPPPELLQQNYSHWVELLRSPSPDLRINALLKVAELRQADTTAKMAELLNDADSEVRFTAIRLIGRIQTEESLNALKSQLESEKDPYLNSEFKRNIRSIEDALKAAEAEKQKQKDIAAGKTVEKPKKPAKKPSRKK